MRSEPMTPSPPPAAGAPAAAGSPPWLQPASGPPSALVVSFWFSVSSAMVRDCRPPSPRGRLVDQHLLDEDGVRLGGRHHEVDAAEQLHPELVGALAAGEILGAQLAQEGLEHVLQPRHV